MSRTGEVLPVKDEAMAHPVASAWRPAFREIVKAFIVGNFAVGGVENVEPLPAEQARRIERYISSYGEALTELPEQAWDTSVAQWMGTHWDVLVDLWTAESGRSGILTQISMLSMFSHPGRSSPTKRGVALNEIFLCLPTPEAPNDVDFSVVNDPNSSMKTFRERLMLHATNKTCAACHVHTDPIGLSLEAFDTIGGHRTSISLEAAFWDALKSAAAQEGVPVARLIARIDSERADCGLSSAIRVWLLTRFRSSGQR